MLRLRRRQSHKTINNRCMPVQYTSSNQAVQSIDNRSLSMRKLSKMCLWLSVLGSILGVSLARQDHFCNRTVTKIIMKPVTKERTVEEHPSKWKFWRKSKVYTEKYVTEEKHTTHHVVSACCTGYRLTEEGGICEPICDAGCPAHASCVEPHRCQCTDGYVTAVSHRDGSHFCEPVCIYACNSGAVCISPDTCTCRSGYRELKPTDDGVSGTCVPICELGNGCANGRCVEPERCVCNAGYLWDDAEQRCMQQSQDPSMHIASDESDGNETLETTSISSQCPEGFLFYEKTCRPETFYSNLASTAAQWDCRQADVQCGEHQACNEDNGNCICTANYIPDYTGGNQSLICRRGSLEEQLSGIDQAVDVVESNMLTMCIIGLSSGTLVVLLVVALIIGRRRRKQTQTSADMQCKFSPNSCDVDEWVP